MLIYLFLLQAWGAPSNSSLLRDAAPTSVLLNEIVEFHPQKTFHFNLKAPQSCGGQVIAKEVSQDSAKCQFSQSGPQYVSLKICDDKETFCKNEDFTVQVAGPRTGALPKPQNATFADPEAAIKKAQGEGKLIFFDFFGTWCPPCRLMDETVLASREFQEAAQAFVKIPLDIDLATSAAWLTRYHIHAYPSYVVADANLREIGRKVGGANQASFINWIKLQEKFKDAPIEAVSADLKKASEEQKIRVARWWLEQDNAEAALAAVKGLTSRSALVIQTYATVQKQKTPEAYKQAIVTFDGHDGQAAEPDVMDWIADLYKIDAKSAQPFVDHFDELMERLIKSPAAAEQGFLTADLYENAGDALKRAELLQLSQAQYHKCAAEYQSQIASIKDHVPRGQLMSQAHCLMGGEFFVEAAQTYARLVKAYPREYMGYRSYARALSKQKKYKEALRKIDRAAELAYGPIWLDVISSKAEILLEMKQKKEARKTLQAALSRVALPADAESLLHYEYQHLNELLKKTE